MGLILTVCGPVGPPHDFVQVGRHGIVAIVIIATPAMLPGYEVAGDGLVGLFGQILWPAGVLQGAPFLRALPVLA